MNKENSEINKLIEFRDNKMKSYSQQGRNSDRKYINKDNNRKLKDEYGNMFIRNEFSIDRDRIKFSRAFRRLQHKAQIYSHKKGDHFRTRLTHTLEVSQISRSLARNLNLNEDLVEAIALGHDIGHTPYGHQGERTLDNVMSGNDDLSGKIKFKMNYGGFKHNFHSLKILDQLEVKYNDILGMNLTWQVLEGILKHTKIKKENKTWDIDRFIQNKKPNCDLEQKFSFKHCLEYEFSVTLEGQIVAIADEIAQRQHDVDDGLRDVDLRLDFRDVAKNLNDKFKEISEEETIYYKNLRNLISSIETVKEEKCIERSELYKVNTLVRNLIDFFIKDVTIYSLHNLKEYNKDITKEDDRIFAKKKFIDFSPIGLKVNKIIESYINGKILNSYNVNRFDGKASHIIRELFKAYYNNPRQMPVYVLKRLTKKIHTVCEELNFDINFNKDTNIKEITFEDSTPACIDKLIRVMKLDINFGELDMEGTLIDKLKENNYIDENLMLLGHKLNVINSKNKEELKEEELFVKAMLEIQYSYLATICDYIAGMTDNYASDEFKNLYLLN